MLRPYERSLQPVHERSHAHDKGVVGARSVQRPAYLELESRAKAEENKIGLAGLRQIRNAAAALRVETTDAESGETVVSGAIPTFGAAVATLSAAESKETEERGKAAASLEC
jgi:hypothetical protein